jgi:hypothetical protein
MRPISEGREPATDRRLPKAFRLLRSAIALSDDCAREMVANLEAPDLAATGDRIERIEEERRALAASMEDDLRGALLSPLDPADLHGLSASIALLTHRGARALYFFGLLGSQVPPADLKALAKLFRRATAEAVAVVEDLTDGDVKAMGERVHSLRRIRNEAHVDAGRLLTPGTNEQRHLLLWRTVAEAIDGAVAQTLAVGAEAYRIATKHD